MNNLCNISSNFRTLEYLMRHLAKVSTNGSNTGMHSKNLAIVWAPNLLRYVSV
jgi:Rho GTPase-activating protein 33